MKGAVFNLIVAVVGAGILSFHLRSEHLDYYFL